VPGTFDPLVVRDFAIALLIGALLGIDRERHKTTEGDVGIGGVRTFTLFALAGAVSAWLARQQQNAWIFVATVMAVAAMTVAGYTVHARRRPDALGLTTEIAAVSTCLLGGMALFGYPEIAVALAIVSSAILTFKQPMHQFVGRLATDDIYAGIKLLVATFVVLPLLPRRTVDPWNVFNPYELWLLVVLISSLSLVGFVAVRWLGRTRGTLLTGVFGGLVSSTAMTVAFARQSHDDPHAGDPFGAGLLLAWAIMFVRVAVEVAIVFPPLLVTLAQPLATMGGAALVTAAVLWRRVAVAEAHGVAPLTAEAPMRNPFSLSPAIRFAVLFAMVLLVVALTRQYASTEGVYVVATLAGVTDVDAITLSMASLARDRQQTGVAATGITIAVMTNTVAKAAMVMVLASRPLRVRAVVGAAAIVAAGIAAVLLA
jgi:uncharacterized membrane protein (DUF4010 family)